MTTQRRNITQPADWWEAFDKEAEMWGMSLSEWIGQACSEYLELTKPNKLSERPPAHRPKAEKPFARRR